MRISFICNYLYINGGWSPWDTRIGGSEEMIVETSKRLSAMGHKVSVFHNGRHGEYEGVSYQDHEDFTPGDVVINMNYPEFKCDKPMILWTSLTQHPDLSHFRAVACISEFAKNNTGIVHTNVVIIPPGYDETKIYPGKKVAKQCFYASSPDRGLDVLLKSWPEVYKAHPDATLILTYGADLEPMDGVINLGSVDEDTMNDIYRTSDIWCHPCTGMELYCMTGIKAQASGCIPVVIPHMALAETVRQGYFAQTANYTEVLIKALSDDHMALRNALVADHYPTWPDSTDQLLKLIENVI